jgi:outer membrane receptor for ferrienterochelin and colicins
MEEGMRIKSRQIVAAMALLLIGARFARAAADAPASQPDSASSDFSAANSPNDVGAAPELDLYKDMPIVVAATKTPQTLQQAPASASVVTASDIELFGYQNLADLLRDQRSFYLETDGLNWFAGVRGFSRSGEWNSRLLVNVDDRPTNELIFGQSHLDTNFVVPMQAMKQVEIIRGPGSALYGTNAVFGVVNVVTKNGSDVNGAEITGTGGTLGTAQGNILLGSVEGGWDLLADINAYTSAGSNQIHYDGVDSPQFNFGNIDHADSESAIEGFFKASKGEFTAEADFENRVKDNSAATYLASFYDPGSMYEGRANAMARVDHDMGGGNSLHAMAYFGYYGYWQKYPLPDPNTGLPTTNYTSTAYDSWLGQDVHYTAQINKQLQLLAGVDGTESLYIRQHDYSQTQGNVLDIPASYSQWAVYGQAEYAATDQLNFTAGLRLDDVQRIGYSLSPRLAAVYSPEQNDTFKALYGRAFREPNLFELQYASPGANTPNPNLDPEVIDTFEAVWERNYGDAWRTSLDYYYWEMHDSMEDVQLNDGSIQTQNVGTQTANGVEAEIDKSWAKRASFRAYASYTWADNAGEIPEQSPKWIVGTALAIPVISRNTFLAIDPQIVGPMKDPTGQFTQPTYITNIVLTSDDLIKNWTFQAGVYNLFAHNARLPAGGPEEQVQPTITYPGTEVRVSVTCRF